MLSLVTWQRVGMKFCCYVALRMIFCSAVIFGRLLRALYLKMLQIGQVSCLGWVRGVGGWGGGPPTQKEALHSEVGGWPWVPSPGLRVDEVIDLVTNVSPTLRTFSHVWLLHLMSMSPLKLSRLQGRLLVLFFLFVPSSFAMTVWTIACHMVKQSALSGQVVSHSQNVRSN
jgi:hypothetical protein